MEVFMTKSRKNKIGKSVKAKAPSRSLMGKNKAKVGRIDLVEYRGLVPTGLIH
jgi:hypothetical protein